MLSEQDVRKYISDLGKAWELKDGKYCKSFQFPSFMDAIEFVNEVARIAEELDDHPIITTQRKSSESS